MGWEYCVSCIYENDLIICCECGICNTAYLCPECCPCCGHYFNRSYNIPNAPNIRNLKSDTASESTQLKLQRALVSGCSVPKPLKESLDQSEVPSSGDELLAWASQAITQDELGQLFEEHDAKNLGRKTQPSRHLARDDGSSPAAGDVFAPLRAQRGIRDESADSEDTTSIISDTLSESSHSTCGGHASAESSDTEYSGDGESNGMEDLGFVLARRLVDQFINNFQLSFDAKAGIVHCTNKPHNAPKANDGPDCTPNANNERDRNLESDHSKSSESKGSEAAQYSAGNKRRRGQIGNQDSPGDNDGEEDDDDDDDGDDRGDKRRKLNSGRPCASKRRLACPYFKRNPEKHRDRRSCKGSGFLAIPYLKEHLYRNHEVWPCPVCYLDLKTDEALDSHVRARDCMIQPQRPSEGVDRTMKSKLKKRKDERGKSDIEKWIHIYQILFPEDDATDIPSPFYDESDNVPASRDPESRFQRYCRRELPQRLGTTLEPIIQDYLRKHGQLHSEQVKTIVRECYDGIVSSFRGAYNARRTPIPTDLAGEVTSTRLNNESALKATEEDVGSASNDTAFKVPEITFEEFGAARFDFSMSSENFSAQLSPEIYGRLNFFDEHLFDTNSLPEGFDYAFGNSEGPVDNLDARLPLR